MGLHDLLTWAIGIGCLLYFIVAMVKPEWFLYIPPEQRNAHAEQMRLISPKRASSEREELAQPEGRYVEKLLGR